MQTDQSRLKTKRSKHPICLFTDSDFVYFYSDSPTGKNLRAVSLKNSFKGTKFTFYLIQIYGKAGSGISIQATRCIKMP